MSKEWLSLLLGLVVAALFAGGFSLVTPEFNEKLEKSTDEVTLYYHQIGIYANADNASRAVASLTKVGLEGYTLHKQDQSVIICGLVFDEKKNGDITSQLKAAGFPILEKQETISSEAKDQWENGDQAFLLELLESR